MRNPSRHRSLKTAAFGVALQFLALGTLSGCMATPAPPDTSPPTAETTPAPTKAAPIFASNDEALAAATAAYAAYSTEVDDFFTNGGRDPVAAVGSLVSKRYEPEVLAGLDDFAKSGNVGRGVSTFDTISLVSYSDVLAGHAQVDLYLCSDFSGIRVFDASGTDVTPAGRPERVPLQVGFVSSKGEPAKLLIDREDSWSGQNFCQ
ncbi:hypothetical protein [Cryobacterium sp. Y11]|uniref:hypothetical protein n=1 Tax=Cryobacterium sp. Y11 TaxID=2045016 RepID=UPI000CE331C7|nr:hypothetical protein [Cryobacterium sp. Y11]